MLNNKVQQLPHYKLTTTINALNETVEDYVLQTNIDIAIAFNSRSLYTANDSHMNNINYIGVTQATGISKGDKIGNYIVDFIQGNYLYLKEVGNNGRVWYDFW